ncbi:MAG: PAS domain S-box protein, partial [Methanobacterium paludis]|nr:PAS domain S-box protein [Methanobacterium paludis]
TFIGHLRETWGLRKDGSKFPTAVSISKWKMGKKEYITSIVRDITQRKESEKQIRFDPQIRKYEEKKFCQVLNT